MRWIFFVMINFLLGFLKLRVSTEFMSGIRVPVKQREITARYLNSDFMAFKKYITRHPKVDFIPIYLPRHYQTQFVAQD